MKPRKGTRLYLRLAKANFEPVLRQTLDGSGNRVFELEVHGSGDWMNRGDLTRLLRIIDKFDAGGKLEFELRPPGPLKIR